MMSNVRKKAKPRDQMWVEFHEKKKKAKTARDQNENRDGKMEQEGGD